MRLLQAMVLPIFKCGAMRLLYFVQRLLPACGTCCRCRACGLTLIDLLPHHAPSAGKRGSSLCSMPCFHALLQTQESGAEQEAAAYMH